MRPIINTNPPNFSNTHEREQNLRVEFLKGTTAAAAGIALAGGLDIARTAYAAGSDELKIALIGCGGRGTGAVVDCLSSCENVRLMAMGDVFKEHAEGSLARLRKDQGGAGQTAAVAKIDVPPERMFIGFDAFQKVIDAGPDIVFLTTPPAFRPASMPRPSRPAGTCSWKSRSASTPQASVR